MRPIHATGILLLFILGLLDVNFSKTITLTITRKLIRSYHPPLLIKNTPLKEKPLHKHFGVTLSENSSGSDHIQRITNRAWKHLNMLRSFKLKLDRSAFEKLNFAYVRTILEKTDSVWENITYLKSIHTEAARIVTGEFKLCSIYKLLWN